MGYTYDQAPIDVTVVPYASESQMCQGFFKTLNDLAHKGVTLAIAHNGSASPRGSPYDLPFIAYRSMYNLTI